MGSKIRYYATVVAKACKYDPLVSCLLIFVFYIPFNIIEGSIERLVFGESFEHWLDPFFILGFMWFAGITTYICAVKFEREEFAPKPPKE